MKFARESPRTQTPRQLRKFIRNASFRAEMFHWPLNSWMLQNTSFNTDGCKKSVNPLVSSLLYETREQQRKHKETNLSAEYKVPLQNFIVILDLWLSCAPEMSGLTSDCLLCLWKPSIFCLTGLELHTPCFLILILIWESWFSLNGSDSQLLLNHLELIYVPHGKLGQTDILSSFTSMLITLNIFLLYWPDKSLNLRSWG